MALVSLRAPFSDAVVEVDSARADELVGLGWRRPVGRPKKSESAEESTGKDSK